MDNVLDVLKDRGFVEQTTHESELFEYFNQQKVHAYIGFDPTASSLHIGHLLPIMALIHLQKAGHCPIALVGGGTGMIGDPSGKTETRQMLTEESIASNVKSIRNQLERYLDFGEGHAVLVNNAAWLKDLKYIEFLRNIGRHFSVNKMIKAESYRQRLEMEQNLAFIEFNYMLLQAYDFLELYNRNECRLQMGGADQWGNIVAGIELIRKIRKVQTYGLTFPLITTASGAKMGKTAKGAVWLDAERTSPYEYFQYWVNTDDKDVCRFLKLFTLLPLSEINEVERLKDESLNGVKMVLAFEATRITHGMDSAIESYRASIKIFGQRSLDEHILPSSAIPRRIDGTRDSAVPTSFRTMALLKKGILAVELFSDVGLVSSKSAARRLVEQGGAYINGCRLQQVDYRVTLTDLSNNEILLSAGKKRIHRILIGGENRD
ncbi:tyrosine--tRNA ligase [Desulfatirhabdium butyrativorans]|uniref:tyrosine--tRNA ligase n=1 Tax=Desulfatirhabdium butyrativorans TaxID=340467 RepID=UPI000552374B|nr:tyrosine--tRNA ligase [Desulfatirhabdium butyrativorans]